MKYNTVIIVLMLFSTSYNVATKNILSLKNKIISPFLKDVKKLGQIHAWINTIVEKNLTHPGYDGRNLIGLVNCVINMCNNKPTLKKVMSNNIIVSTDKTAYKVESVCMFDDTEIKEIVLNDVIQTTLQNIEQWSELPKKIYMKTLVNRLVVYEHENENNTIDWHQDTYCSNDKKADYSLILPLSDRKNDEHGWYGGNILLKSNKPENVHCDKLTITLECNQGLLFDNKNSSYAVTNVHTKNEKAVYDTLEMQLYLTDPFKN